MKKIDLSRYAPLGINVRSEWLGYAAGLVVAIVYSMIYLLRYFNARQNLYEWTLKGWQLRDGAIMPDFAALMEGMLLVFAVIALTMLGLAAYHYIYHRIDTKSYYVMRRLPSRWELHKRCLTLPVAGLLICGAAALIVILIYYWIYMGCTPKECLMPGQWAIFWR